MGYPGTILTWALDALAVGIVAVVVVAVPLLVARDAWRGGASRVRALGWGLAALALLPLGLGFRLLLGWQAREEGEEPA